MTERYYSVADIAKEAGIARETLRSYVAKGLLPEPAVIVGHGPESKGWTHEQVKTWLANRPGRGARTDLRT